MKYENVKVNSKRWFDLALLPNEEFKDIKGYEGFYQISNYGRVKSLEREIVYIAKNRYTEFTRNQKIEEKIVKNSFDKDGYVQVGLSYIGEAKTKRVHFLVAQAFISNPNNLTCINHKDEDKTNNRLDNLEWCTIAYNNAYGSKTKPINQFDKNWCFIKRWKSSAEICKQLGFKRRSNITSCCKKRPHCKTAYGYIWRYADE